MAIKIDEHADIATFYDQETGLLWQQDQWDFKKPIECPSSDDLRLVRRFA